MTDKEAAILNRLSAASGWMNRAKAKMNPVMHQIPAEALRAFFQAHLDIEKAIKILRENNAVNPDKENQI